MVCFMDNVPKSVDEEACGTFANFIVDACNEEHFHLKEDDESFVVLMKFKIARMTMEIPLTFRKSIPKQECPSDIVRCLGLFSQAPRKERKRTSLSH